MAKIKTFTYAFGVDEVKQNFRQGKLPRTSCPKLNEAFRAYVQDISEEIDPKDSYTIAFWQSNGEVWEPGDSSRDTSYDTMSFIDHNGCPVLPNLERRIGHYAYASWVNFLGARPNGTWYIEAGTDQSEARFVEYLARVLPNLASCTVKIQVKGE
jgi:hypothetical protein